jgi:hypothetical protein
VEGDGRGVRGDGETFVCCAGVVWSGETVELCVLVVFVVCGDVCMFGVRPGRAVVFAWRGGWVALLPLTFGAVSSVWWASLLAGDLGVGTSTSITSSSREERGYGGFEVLEGVSFFFFFLSSNFFLYIKEGLLK